MNPLNYVILALIIFCIGAVTVLVRRSAVISLLGVEMMLNSANLVFVAFAKVHQVNHSIRQGLVVPLDATGQVMAFFVMVVAAAEVVVGLAIIVSIFRARRTTSVDDVNLLKN